ncbi:VOC family protein [Streptomonospora halophila]|uniref:VOC family protein n=1 Tax=Streptomonospora halophila TaxID=427369 RepID=A0ABP9GBK3_9ACTN
MTGARVEIRDVVVDCREPERLAEFWSQVLGRPIAARVGPYVFLGRGSPESGVAPEGEPGHGASPEAGSGAGSGAGPGVVFQRVDDVDSRKNRVHLDLSCADPAAERRRIEELGGRRLPEYADGGFLVMADPEGNEFCLVPRGVFDVDDQGRADYLDGSEDGI